MAREMTPQERADLKEIARKLVLQINEITPMQWDKHDDKDQAIVLAALQTTRQAALLEAAEIAKECAKERRKEEEKYGEHVKNDPRSIWASCRASEAEVIVAKIDRLAQEG